MRVIGGSARGRHLESFAGREIRPTPDRVREALFSMLYSRYGSWDGRTVLDLFAGSGALGIEALSRGAAHAWFVDSSRQAAAVIRANLDRCGFAGRGTILMRDLWSVLPLLATGGPYDLIFADPPYSRGHAPRLVEAIGQLGLLAGNGLLSLETAPEDPVPEAAGALRLLERRRYGSTMLNLFHQPVEEQA